MSNQNEYFEYRVPSKFIGEIQIILAVILLVSGFSSICLFCIGLIHKAGHERDMALGYITYLSLAMAVSITDSIFAGMLISGANKMSLPRCILWRGSAITTLVIFGLLTMPFLIMLETLFIFLIFLPTLLFKPFALWIVNAFINELRVLENFPTDSEYSNISDTIPPENPTSKCPNRLKRTTTIFKFKRASPDSPNLTSTVVTSKISPIPEDQE